MMPLLSYRSFGGSLVLPTRPADGKSDMDKESRIEGVPDWFIDAFMTARHWWLEDDSRLLPGEEGGSTVFVVDFADGCRYCGYTSGRVFSRLGELMGGPFDSGSSDFVIEHGRRMVYLVRCVASGMDERKGAGPAQPAGLGRAPDAWAGSNGTTLEYAGCWLSGKVVGEAKYLAQSK